MSSHFEVSVDSCGSVLSLRGECDMDDVDLVRAVVHRHWPDLSSTHLVVDVREIAYIGSACLGELIRLNAACASLDLRHTQPQLDRLLEITGLAEIFGAEAPRSTSPTAT